MKEKLYMIPLNDAVNANDECPFCFIERKTEQELLDFALGNGSSYMESDVRDMTDKYGFCRTHFKKMFDYGNALGNGWILKTHYKHLIEEFDKEAKNGMPGRISLRTRLTGASSGNSMSAWAQKKEDSCYICKYYREHFDCYMDTFFYMYQTDEDFKSRIKNGKGFCLAHFGDLCAAMEKKLPEAERADFYQMLCSLMHDNLERIYEDVSWLIEKFDYQNEDADWKNSKDAVQRGMQKLKGGYPADPAYRMRK